MVVRYLYCLNGVNKVFVTISRLHCLNGVNKVDVAISRRSFVFGQSRAKVSAGFTNVGSQAVAAFDLVYCSLSVLRFVFVPDISK